MRLYISSFFLILFISCGCVSATSYYVSTTGNNSGSGDIDHPWLTPDYAATKVHSGDTIYLRSGIYQHPNIIFRGLNNVSLLSYPGEAAILDNISGTKNIGIYAENCSNLNIFNLTFIKYKYSIYTTFSENIHIYNITSNNSLNNGIVLYKNTNNSIIENCEVTNSGWDAISIVGNFAVLNGGSGIPSSNLTVRNCNIHDNTLHNGIDLYGNLEDIYFYNNSVYNNGRFEGFYTHAGYDLQTRVHIYNNTFNTNLDGISLQNVSNTEIYNNIVVNASRYCLTISGDRTENLTIENNTFANTDPANFSVTIGTENLTMKSNNLNGSNRRIRFNDRNTNSNNFWVINPINTTQIRTLNGAGATIKFTNNKAFTSSGGSVYFYPNRSETTVPVNSFANIADYNFYVIPSSGSVLMSSVSTFNTSANLNSTVASFTVKSTNVNNTTFLVAGLHDGGQYTLKMDGNVVSTLIANNSDYVKWSSSNLGQHTFILNYTDAPVWDVNKDGIVDLLDIITTVRNYGITTTAPYPEMDVDKDGMVDLRDLILVMSHFGKK